MKIPRSLKVRGSGKLAWFGILAAVLAACSFTLARTSTATPLAQIANTPGPVSNPYTPVDWGETPPCAGPVCARILITQANDELADVVWSSTGLRAAAPFTALTTSPGETETGLIKDSGVVSPDGKKAAFTSLKMDSGGPVFLLDLQSGAWTNLIQAMNASHSGQPARACRGSVVGNRRLAARQPGPDACPGGPQLGVCGGSKRLFIPGPSGLMAVDGWWKQCPACPGWQSFCLFRARPLRRAEPQQG